MASTLTTPPYDPTTLKAPLTDDQRNQIRAWMILSNTVLQFNGSTNLTTAQINAFNDADLISHYTALVGVQKAVTTGPNGFELTAPGLPSLDIGQFLSRLSNPNTWIRVGEFTVGIVLLGIGLRAILGNSSAPGKAVAKSAKIAGKLVPEVKSAQKVASPVTHHTQTTRINGAGKTSVSHVYKTTSRNV